MEKETTEHRTEWLNDYARVVRVGKYLHVSGITAWDDGMPGNEAMDTYTQVVRCFNNVEAVLFRAGLSLAEVVRVRIYLAKGADRKSALDAWAGVFSSRYPVTAVIEVGRLFRPEILAEIEVDACFTIRSKTPQISN